MSFITQTFVRGLSISQREHLIDHVREPQPITRRDNNQSIMRLMALKLLRTDRPAHPRFSELTEAGREAAAMILGEYADALVSAGYLEPDYCPPPRPLDALKALKAQGRREPATPAVLAAQMAETRAKAAR